ncbi:hypothetical protein [Actinoplanes sp. NBRC 103695]|uniref:hypothetical protein n=1 Tax=Actinoplanes sp. NBRC 103695 TaxID=3032202 RepID=UPI0024A2C43B|nr:hypothetical protein [Actinoplanes sp. NBRC 103695]GLY94299.1 hypothetical protein Acsp02_15550 [Actinoplanes sp. NBRC 103695]
MGAEERRVWILGIVAVLGYAAYWIAVGAGAGYRPAMLWTIGAAIAAGIAGHVAAVAIWPEGANQKDQRDREIDRFGQAVGQSMLVIGGVAALALALAETSYFWIANTIYLAFVLSAVLGSTTKLVAYRRGFHPW